MYATTGLTRLLIGAMSYRQNKKEYRGKPLDAEASAVFIICGRKEKRARAGRSKGILHNNESCQL